jgi:hypothetical protein
VTDGADPSDASGLAVVLQRLARDQQALMDYLDASLGAALPGAVRAQRDHLFNRGPVNHIEILLGPQVFDLRLQHGQVTAAIGDVVGGVALSRTPCDPDAWIAALVAALEREARTSDAVAAALTRLT